MNTKDEEWPLAPSQDQQVLQALAALTVGLPYEALGSQDAQAAITHLREWTTSDENASEALTAITEGRRWDALTLISERTAHWLPADRDYAGLGLVLDDGFVPTSAMSEDPAVYWRTVDTSLDAIGCGYAAQEIIDGTLEIVDTLLSESKSSARAIATSGELTDYLELAHQAQASFTGIYIPGAESAVRWGQRKLENAGDGELSFSLATEVVQLQYLAGAGHIARVRRYGDLLSEDVRRMSTARAYGHHPDRRAKQISMFAVMLDIVGMLLDERHEHLGNDAAPTLEGMRLSEAYAVAAAHSITVVEIDGQRTEESGDRWVVKNENWHVRAQSPQPGEPLGANRQIECWVLKRGELLCDEQRRAIRLRTSPSTGPEQAAASGTADGTPLLPHRRSLEFQPLPLARSLANSWKVELIEHDGSETSPARESHRKTNPGAWYVRKMVAAVDDPSTIHVWVLRRGETNLTTAQAKAYLQLLKAASASAGEPDGSGA